MVWYGGHMGQNLEAHSGTNQYGSGRQRGNTSGQAGINKGVLIVCHQYIQLYDSLFEGTEFEAGQLKTVNRQEERWRLRGGQFKISGLHGKWEGMEELNKPKLVIGSLRLEDT